MRATPDQLRDALGACAELHAVYRRLLRLTLDELRLIEDQIGQLDEELARLLRTHQDAVQGLAAVPGLGVDSAQQIIAEVGPTAATFASAKRLASWVGACPGNDESAGINHSRRSPNGNRQMRRLLNQAANAAVKTKGSIFELVYRRLVVRLGHAQTIGAIAHRLCRLVWKILHERVVYEERGPAVTKAARATARRQDDPRTPKPRLPHRTRPSSGRQSSMSGRDFRPWFFSANYTLSRLYGNYSGLASSDEISTPTTGTTSATAQQQAGSIARPGGNVNRYWDLDELLWDSQGNLDVRGRLATDRPHVVKLYGAYSLPFGTQVGAFFYGASGTPISTYVTSDHAPTSSSTAAATWVARRR